jgi:predicted nuclease of predicted toxin-antitoxin system
MKLLADHDVYAATSRFVAALGHEVVTAYELGFAERSDEELLELAHDQERILLTRDRDFGNLVFVGRRQSGVIYLRILPSSQAGVHSELQRVLQTYTETELQRSFVVVEPGQHRIRRLGP